MIMMKTVPSATKHIHVWRERTGYAAICVPFGTIDSVQTYRMSLNGVVFLVTSHSSVQCASKDKNTFL